MALINPFTNKANKSQLVTELPNPAVELSADQAANPGDLHTAVLAGGCFWCVEGVYLELDGVTSVVSGYAGGSKQTANYEAVCSGSTEHAEAIKVTYDARKITFAQLLKIFFTVIDPTTKNRQGPDSGPQYRSAIFYENEDQKKVAQAYISQLDAAKIFPSPIVTTLEPLQPGAFYPAEDYHQNYTACNPGNPYIQRVALPKIAKVREKFADQLKAS
jgi:peptide-methionine (S)-S-oxide reductase